MTKYAPIRYFGGKPQLLLNYITPIIFTAISKYKFEFITWQRAKSIYAQSLACPSVITPAQVARVLALTLDSNMNDKYLPTLMNTTRS